MYFYFKPKNRDISVWTSIIHLLSVLSATISPVWPEAAPNSSGRIPWGYFISGDHSLTSQSELCCTNGNRTQLARAQLCLSAAPNWFLMPRPWHSLSCCCEQWTASLFACYRKNTTKDQTSFLSPAKSVPILWLAATLLLRSQPPLSFGWSGIGLETKASHSF